MSARKRESRRASHRAAEQPQGKTKSWVKERVEAFMCRNVGSTMYVTNRMELLREAWDREIRGSIPCDPDLPHIVA